jgi:hypothetical protein
MKRIFHFRRSQLKEYFPEYEPGIYFKLRVLLVIVGALLAIGLGVYGLFWHESFGLLAKRHVVYISDLSLIGTFALAVMVRQGMKIFWLSFIILLPFLYIAWIIVFLVLFGFFIFSVLAQVCKTFQEKNPD